MRRVTFDYANTCPKIDRAITDARAEILDFVGNLIEEASPLLSPTSVRELSEGYAERLYSDLENVFEETRSANEDMRREAERQIAALLEEISDLEAQVSDLESRVES